MWWKKNLIMMGAALAAFSASSLKAFTLGKKAAQKKQAEKALKLATIRLEVENEINKKSDADVRADLAHWLRNQ
ncbi:hypothetical protein [Bartonella sp. CB169]|uniref:hypothetical protein n=1 Tax=Bartonella sp. CB169 TaxID=3112257 RepID=UPI00300E0005